jgi:DNA-binding transcriptional regulator LsrR (DeoR family)
LTIRPRYTRPDEREAELENVVQAARLLSQRRSQQDIAKALGVSPSTVSRWISRAEDEGIIQFRVVPPNLLRMQEKLESILPGGRKVRVVPGGPGRNVDNLGAAGAEKVLDAILAVSASTPEDKAIRLVLSCGTTVTSVIKELITLLEDRQLSNEPIRHRLEIYPSTLYGDSRLDPIYPHTIVAHLGILGGERLSEKVITAHALQLPEKFYTWDEPRRKRCREDWGLDHFETLIRNGDIFVLGSGTLTNSSYTQIIGQLDIRDLVEEVKRDAEMQPLPQVLYTPIRKDGQPDARVSEKIVGVKVGDIKSFSERKDKHVILVAGGREKFEALQTIIRFPCYNILVTDSEVALEAIRLSGDGV